MEKTIYQLCREANERLEEQGSKKRFFIIDEDRYFRCNNIDEGDDFDELSTTEIVRQAKRVIES